MTPYLSIIIPSYNEETVIEETLRQAIGYLEGKGLLYEILVVCDGCKDNTGLIAERFAKGKEGVTIIDRKVNMCWWRSKSAKSGGGGSLLNRFRTHHCPDDSPLKRRDSLYN